MGVQVCARMKILRFALVGYVIDVGVQVCALMKILRFALVGYVIDSGVQACARMQILDQKPNIRSKGHKITFKWDLSVYLYYTIQKLNVSALFQRFTSVFFSPTCIKSTVYL
jgi:hypothetical protein